MNLMRGEYGRQNNMNSEIQHKLANFYKKGIQLEKEKRYDEALLVWQEGYSLIPEPRWRFDISSEFLAAMGDVYFLRKGMYREAYECFDTMRGYGGFGNPYVMLRMGECCLELGDMESAAEYLRRAWLEGGKEIFEPDENGEDDGRKYYEFLLKQLNIETDGDGRK